MEITYSNAARQPKRNGARAAGPESKSGKANGSVPLSRLPKGPRILVYGGSSVVSRIFLQELQRAGYRAARAAGFNDLPKDPQAERVDLALILLDIPPSRELEAVRWFKLNRPQIKMLLVWEGHWRGRDSVRELSLLPQLIMPFKTDQLVAVVRQLLADQRDQGMPLLAVPPASGQTMSAVA